MVTEESASRYSAINESIAPANAKAKHQNTLEYLRNQTGKH